MPVFRRFILTGAILGAITGLVIASQGAPAANYDTGAGPGYFIMLFGALGAIVGGLVAVVIDIRGSRAGDASAPSEPPSTSRTTEEAARPTEEQLAASEDDASR